MVLRDQKASTSYIQRRLREIYGFEGSPIIVNMRVREKRKR